MPTRSDPIAAEMGLRIRTERKAKGLSQKELAELLDCTPAAVGNWEQGTRRIKLANAKALADIFKLPAAYFLVEISKQEALMLVAMRNAGAA